MLGIIVYIYYMKIPNYIFVVRNFFCSVGKYQNWEVSMVRKARKKIMILALGLGVLSVNNNFIYANEQVEEFTFDPIIVTAQRCKNNDINIESTDL